ncbi:MAG: response regulator transcription factor [Pseudomonadota bacterium]
MSQLQTEQIEPQFALAPEGWVLIVDDHPLFCEALELTLRSISDYTRLTKADSLKSALDVLQQTPPPALVILDLNLPDVTGMDGLVRMIQAVQPAPVIVVSSVSDNRIVTTALKAGAAGYVPKHSPRTTFHSALEAIASGRIYVPENFVATEVPSQQARALEAIGSLTRQQSRILELICDGLLNKQIAYELSIAETTVKAHVTAIMRKLGVQSRTQAVLVARDANFSEILPESDPAV